MDKETHELFLIRTKKDVKEHSRNKPKLSGSNHGEEKKKEKKTKRHQGWLYQEDFGTKCPIPPRM